VRSLHLVLVMRGAAAFYTRSDGRLGKACEYAVAVGGFVEYKCRALRTQQMADSTYLRDHQVRSATPMIHCLTEIDVWYVTIRVLIQ